MRTKSLPSCPLNFFEFSTNYHNSMGSWAPFYYLKHTTTDTIVTTYPRKYLSNFCKSLQFNSWSTSKSSHQKKHIENHPTLEFFIKNIPFDIRSQPHFCAIMNNRLPSMRLLKHIPHSLNIPSTKTGVSYATRQPPSSPTTSIFFSAPTINKSPCDSFQSQIALRV
jgi:hypothetical protein